MYANNHVTTFEVFMKKICVFLPLVFFLFAGNLSADGWVTQKERWCVYSKGKSQLELNLPHALRINKKKCNKDDCNDKDRNYLKKCKAYVHADCYRVFKKRGNRYVRQGDTATGFHKGKSEGGKSNNHYWDDMHKTRIITLKGKPKRGDWVHAYDKSKKGRCSGKKLVEFQWK